MLVDKRMLGQSHNDWRHDVELAHLVRCDQFEETVQVEAKHRDDDALLRLRVAGQHRQSEHREERHYRDRRLAGMHWRHRCNELVDVHDEIAVRQSHALGQPGSARRVMVPAASVGF